MSHEPSTRHLSSDELSSFLDQLAQDLQAAPASAAVRPHADSRASPSPPFDPEAPTRLYQRPHKGTESLLQVDKISGAAHGQRPRPPTVVRLARTLTVGLVRRELDPQPEQQPRTVLELERPVLPMPASALPSPVQPRVPVGVRRPLVALALCGLVASAAMTFAGGLSTPPARARKLPPPNPVVQDEWSLPTRPEAVASTGVSAPTVPVRAKVTSHPTAEQAPTAEDAPTAERSAATSRQKRAAVDLLLSSDTRAALDAYRALLRAEPDSGPFREIVRLLERELGNCPLSEPGRAQCAG